VTLLPGTFIADKFRVDRVIGKGGMGTVVVATHLQLEQLVAIKFLNPGLAQQPGVAERFLREARSSAKLRSEYVCKVLDVGQTDDGSPYMVMECLEGEDLGRLITRATLPVSTAADFVMQACVAIAEAHAVGIVHRDLKPSNLFLTQRLDGGALVKVLDFGIATAPGAGESRLTQTTSLMGSPAYMSPEQLRSAKEADVRSDVWSLGVILYELVSGRLPFPGNSITEVAVKIAVDDAIPLASGHPAFDAMVMGAIEKDVARRYQSVAVLANALAPFGGGQARALAPMIGKLLGGSASAMELARGATVPAAIPGANPVVDGRAYSPTVAVPQPGVQLPTQYTTLGASASATTMPVAPKKSRAGLIVGLVGFAALAGGVGVYVATRGGGDVQPTPPPAPAPAPAPPIVAVVTPDAAVVVEPPVAMTDAAGALPSPPRDAAAVVVVPAVIVDAAAPAIVKPHVDAAGAVAIGPKLDGGSVPEPPPAPPVIDNTKAREVQVMTAIGRGDCAKAKAIAKTSKDPIIAKAVAACVQAKESVAEDDANDDAAKGKPLTVRDVRALNEEARTKLATDPAASIKTAKQVLAHHPQNGLSWAIIVVAYCKLHQAGNAKTAFASYESTAQREIRIDVRGQCKGAGVALPDDNH
jgi:serine/threonine-protein kinase